jgi:acyl-coenzyme A thioesterase PaaI-like protein
MLAEMNSEVFVANSDGTGVKNLTNHPAFDGWPAWSPDGREIAFASNRNATARSWRTRPTLSATRIVASPVHHGGVLETCECCRHLAMGAARNGTLQAMFAATNAPISDDSVILAPEVGWTSVVSLGGLAPIRSLVSGDEASDRIRIAYFRRERDGTLVGKVWFGPGVEGPPGHAQGGSIAAVLDEAMGAAARMIGHRAIASTLRLRFRLKVPLQRVMTLEASIRAAHGPRLHVNAKVCDDTGAPFAEGSGLFVRLPPERDRTTAEM